MKNQKRYFVFFLFALISLVNTAFIFKNSKDSTFHRATQSLEAPPQYKALKLTFFEKIIVNKAVKKSEEKPFDLDKMAKQSQLFGRMTWITGFFTLLFIWIFPDVVLLILAIALVMAMIAVNKARRVEGNSLSTTEQKDMAKIGKTTGCWGFIILILCLIGAFFLFPTRFL